MGSPFALELKGITKTFGSTIANKDVDLQVKNGEILSILGENGSGKTTLDEYDFGDIFPGCRRRFLSTVRKLSSNLQKMLLIIKIGMIHQHFKLVDVFNGCPKILFWAVKDGNKYNLKEAEKRVKAI